MQPLAAYSMVFSGYCGDDCASEGEQRAARGLVQGINSMDDTRERMIALEVKVDHLSEQLRMASKKLDDIHADWQKVKGAKWVMAGVASLSATISAVVVKFWPFVK
jgi:hypothetical protein